MKKISINRVALVVPNYKLRNMFGNPTSPPLGIALLAGALRNDDIIVTIIDADAENLEDKDVLNRVEKFGADIAGISCNYISKENPSVAISSLLKSRGFKVFWGGNHATAISDTIINKKYPVDYLLKGEGEISVPLLIKSLNEGCDLNSVPGLIDLTGPEPVWGVPQVNMQNLKDLPEPAYDLLPMNLYPRYGILTSRGCPYKCAYCASTTIAGRKLRFRPSNSVVKEMQKLENEYGKKPFWFMDDTFTASRKNVDSVLNSIEDSSWNFEWSCLSSVAFADADMFLKMKKNGCQYISVGVESTHQYHQKYIGKPIDEESVIKIVKCARNAGLRIYGFFIIGFPGESWSTIHSRYRVIEQARFDDVAVNMLIPLPGTAIWHELVSSGSLNPDNIKKDTLFARVSDKKDSYDTAKLVQKWTALSADELIHAVNKCRVIGRNASPEYIERHL
jgi:radical SAM superfamily enzyme YgiQ (UPF0313 family)